MLRIGPQTAPRMEKGKKESLSDKKASALHASGVVMLTHQGTTFWQDKMVITKQSKGVLLKLPG